MTDKPTKKDRSWHDDEFARHEVFVQLWQIAPLILVLVFVLPAWLTGVLVFVCAAYWKLRRTT